ncbi:lysylphosphatidylglycerol synthase transmembrane domain-containing protein, partial [Chloroflexota bacterium]
MKALKRWQFWVAVLISVTLLYISLRGLPLDEFWAALKQANYWWLIPGVAVYFVGVWARAWRWHYLLRPVKAISTGRMFPIVAIGYFGNNIFPARAGEVLRAVVLKRKEGVAISASLATIIVERIFDGVVMLSFIFLNLQELASLTGDSGFMGSIQTVALWGSIAFIGALAVFLLAAMFPTRSEAIAAALIKRFVPVTITPPNVLASIKLGFAAIIRLLAPRSGRAISLIERLSPDPQERREPIQARKT